MQKTLRQIYDEHHGKVSDKWSLYLVEWDRLFAHYRDLQIRLLEIGIQNGGSLEIWGKYFSKAEKIVGCDIDPKCANLRYEDDRIAVVVGDANSSGGESEILRQSPAFDIIIDDGSHKSSDIVRSFARYFPLINDGGVYVVEDLHASYWKNFEGGIYNPLSAMAFFKRLADVVNYEHWRNNKPRVSLLTAFAENLGIEFKELELTKIHSIEFANSLCVIKKFPPEKNVLGKRIIVGTDECVTSESTKLNGTVIQDFEMDIKDDADLDVFELISHTHSLTQTVSERDQSMQTLSAQLEESEQTVQALSAQLVEINRSKAWKIALLFRRIRVLIAPPDSLRARLLLLLIKVIYFPFEKIRRYRRLREDLGLIRSSGLFDRDWYLTHNPDVAQAKLDPLLHYLRSGGFEGRDPSPRFSSSWYLENYKDVKKGGVNPLVHYLRHGMQEGRMAKLY